MLTRTRQADVVEVEHTHRLAHLSADIAGLKLVEAKQQPRAVWSANIHMYLLAIVQPRKRSNFAEKCVEGLLQRPEIVVEGIQPPHESSQYRQHYWFKQPPPVSSFKQSRLSTATPACLQLAPICSDTNCFASFLPLDQNESLLLLVRCRR